MKSNNILAAIARATLPSGDAIALAKAFRVKASGPSVTLDRSGRITASHVRAGADAPAEPSPTIDAKQAQELVAILKKIAMMPPKQQKQKLGELYNDLQGAA